jgi:hypothetical protein
MTTPPVSDPQTRPQFIQTEIAVRGIRLDGGTHFTLWIRFIYDIRDPYALQLVMGEQADLSDATAWIVARETVYIGCELRTTAGQGDFYASYIDEQTVQLTLQAPNEGDTDVVLSVPRPKLSAFLQRTEIMAPLGREDEAIDMDALLNQLMGR